MTLDFESMQVAKSALRHGIGSAISSQLSLTHPQLELWSGLSALAVGQAGAADSWFEQGLEKRPTDPLLLGEQALGFEAQGKVDRAILLWAQAQAWGEMIQAAQRALAGARYGDALQLLFAAEVHEPVKVVTYQASALLGQGETDIAIELLRRSLVSWPRASEQQMWLVLLGDALTKKSEWSDAINAYQRAIAIGETSIEWRAYLGLGQAQYFGGQGITLALQDVSRGIELEPADAEGYVAMADLLRADKRYQDADAWYQRAAQRDPGNVWIGVKRVDNLLDAQEVTAALGAVRELILEFPTEPHPYYQLALIYQRQGELEMAIAAAEESVSLDRSANAWYRVVLAELYERAGRIPEALRTYRAALVLDPSNHDAQTAVTRLQAKQ